MNFDNNCLDELVETDVKNVWRITLNSLPVDETMIHFNPYLFSVLEMRNENIGNYDEDGNFIYPWVTFYSIVIMIKIYK